MSDPAQEKRPLDDSAESGARRRIDDDVAPGDGPLPPPPRVITSRPRIMTGRYAIVTPVQPSEKKK
jgi:hypothetical protein